jgi:hypothetical protein
MKPTIVLWLDLEEQGIDEGISECIFSGCVFCFFALLPAESMVNSASKASPETSFSDELRKLKRSSSVLGRLDDDDDDDDDDEPVKDPGASIFPRQTGHSLLVPFILVMPA